MQKDIHCTIFLNFFKPLVFDRDLLQVAELKGKDFFHFLWWGREKRSDNLCSDLRPLFSYTASNLFYIHYWKEA